MSPITLQSIPHTDNHSDMRALHRAWELVPDGHDRLLNGSEAQMVGRDMDISGTVLVTFTVVLCSLVVTGVLGNALVILVLLRSQWRRNTSTTNAYILHLSMADLLFLLFCAPFQGTVYILNHWPYGWWVCKMAHYCQFCTVYASVWILTCMSVDRYLAIGHPLKSVKWRHPTRATRISLLMWTSAAVVSIPWLILYETDEYETEEGDVRVACFDAWSDSTYHYRKWVIQFGFLIGFLIPSIVIFCMALLITISLRMSTHQSLLTNANETGEVWVKKENENGVGVGNGIRHGVRTGSGSGSVSIGSGNGVKMARGIEVETGVEDGSGAVGGVETEAGDGAIKIGAKFGASLKRRPNTTRLTQNGTINGLRASCRGGLRRRKRVGWLVFALSLVFFICWAPHNFSQIWLNFDSASLDWITDHYQAFFIIKLIAHMMTYLNSSLNPLLYSIGSNNFFHRLALICGLASNENRPFTRSTMTVRANSVVLTRKASAAGQDRKVSSKSLPMPTRKMTPGPVRLADQMNSNRSHSTHRESLTSQRTIGRYSSDYFFMEKTGKDALPLITEKLEQANSEQCAPV